MSKSVSSVGIPQTISELCQIGVALFILLVLFFYPATMGGHALLPADLVFDRDPLWQPLAPADFTDPGNALLADQVNQFYTWRAFTRRALAQGTLPLWNPYSSGGQPFVGNAQSALFDPLTLAGWPFPLWASFAVTAILRLLVAGFFTYLLCREIGLARMGATVGALTFMFSGPLMVWIGYPLASVICWLPALLWATERAFTPRPPSVGAWYTMPLPMGGLWVSFFIALQFFGGHPETSFLVLLTWGAYSLYRIITVNESWRAMLRALLWFVWLALLGTLLAAVQLLPFLETLWHSTALANRQADNVNGWSNMLAARFIDWREWAALLTSVLPNFFGTPLNGSYWYPAVNFNELTLYVGLLPFALALVATLHIWRNRAVPARVPTLFFLVWGLMALGVALRLPLFNTINHLPLFDISNNGRLRLVYALCMAVAAGAGAEQMLHDELLQRRVGRLFTLIAVASLLLMAMTYAGFWYYTDELIRSGRDYYAALAGTPHLSHPAPYYAQLAELRHVRKLALYRPTPQLASIVMYLPVLMALMYATWMRWGRGKMVGWLLLAMIIADGFLVWQLYNPTIRVTDILPEPGAIRFLRADKSVYRIAATGPILNPNTSTAFGVADIRGYDPMTPWRYVQLLRQIDGFYPIGNHHYFTHANASLLDLLNVKYLLTAQMPNERWTLVYEDHGPVKVYANQAVVPRAFIVHAAEVVSSPDEALARVTAPGFDFRRVVILEQDISYGQETTQQSSTSTTFTAQETQRVRLQVETEADGFLVLTDTYMPGWRASIDGEFAEILRANYAFRAIMIPAGRHDLEFSYQPISFQIGAYVSVIGTVLWFACFMTLRGNRNRYAASPPRFTDLSLDKSVNPINPVP